MISIALLTGGSDRPYVFGLTNALLSRDIRIDLIGSEELDLPEFNARAGIKFLKFRGSQSTNATAIDKVTRILSYYARLIRYAATAKPDVFHILWNNKFEVFDRTLLMLYYKLLSKKVMFTAHNVNAAKRDNKDTILNRLTLRAQYSLADHIFVHTEKMKQELMDEFGTRSSKVTVIPFGINNSIPETSLTSAQAKQKLSVPSKAKTILFFGRITPYKGLECLLASFRQLLASDPAYRLIIAGRVDRCEEYWTKLKQGVYSEIAQGSILINDEFIPDSEVETYFKAADALVLPYTDVYQSGVLFLGQNFGLPVIAADVGSLSEDVIENKTGFLFKPQDAVELAQAIRRYFECDLYKNLEDQRQFIRAYATEKHSWDTVAHKTEAVYASQLNLQTLRSNHLSGAPANNRITSS